MIQPVSVSSGTKLAQEKISPLVADLILSDSEADLHKKYRLLKNESFMLQQRVANLEDEISAITINK